MPAIEIRPFRRSDRDQLTALVNAHAQAVVPGASVPVNAVLSQIERQPGEFIVDPWVRERVTLVAEQRGRISAAAHLLRYGTEVDVGPSYRGAGEIRWLLSWPDAPFWPDASEAGRSLVEAVIAQLRRWQVRDILADGTLPAPGVYGIPEQWPHIAALLREAGFTDDGRTEVVLLASIPRLARRTEPTNLTLARTLGITGTRFTARRDGDEVGVIEVDTALVDAARLASQPGWADIGNLWVTEGNRREGVGTWLLSRAADWLELGGTIRLIGYAAPEETDTLAFLEHAGFTRLTTTTRGWRLDL